MKSNINTLHKFQLVLPTADPLVNDSITPLFEQENEIDNEWHEYEYSWTNTNDYAVTIYARFLAYKNTTGINCYSDLEIARIVIPAGETTATFIENLSSHISLNYAEYVEGTNLFIGFHPQEDITKPYIVIYDAGGRVNRYASNFFIQRVNIKCYSDDYDEGMDFLQTIEDFLVNEVVDTASYHIFHVEVVNKASLLQHRGDGTFEFVLTIDFKIKTS
jgi:hypothetical protein